MTDRAEQARPGDGHARTVAGRAVGDAPLARPVGPVGRSRELWARLQRTRPLRANARFGVAGGGVLTGGIAYSALFSVFAGLTLGWTVAMAVLGGDTELRDNLVRTLAGTLPGVIDTGDGSGLLSPGDLVLTPGLSIAGAVSVVVLVLTAISAMAAMRTAIRAMFGAPTVGVSALVDTGRRLAGAAGMALAVLLSAVLSTATGAVASWVVGALGQEAGAATVLVLLGRIVAFVVDALTFMLLVVVLAGQHPPRRDLVGGAAIAATGIGVVRFLGASAVAGSADRDPLLGSFAAIVTLLVWINVIARIVLLAAAWTADPPLPVAAVAPDEAAGNDTAG